MRCGLETEGLKIEVAACAQLAYLQGMAAQIAVLLLKRCAAALDGEPSDSQATVTSPAEG